jgi:quercetin 2,3-dioxygenase
MIRVLPYEQLGHRQYGWLDARYHFSFGEYHNPGRMSFGLLRVINDDVIKAGAGFPAHGHQDMEIITYVRKGAISHRDSLGNEGRTAAGDVQVMSAGTGVQHSEFNKEDEDTTLYQIWIYPRARGLKPRWSARAFPKDHVAANDSLPVLVSGYPEDTAKGALEIYQDAAIYGGRIAAGSAITQPLRHGAYLLVSEGTVDLDGHSLKKGDAAEISREKSVILKALSDAEIVMIDVPAA